MHTNPPNNPPIPWLDDYRVLGYFAESAALEQRDLVRPSPMHAYIAGQTGFAQHGIAAIWVLRWLQACAEMQAIVLPHQRHPHEPFWHAKAAALGRITVHPATTGTHMVLDFLRTLTERRLAAHDTTPTVVLLHADYCFASPTTDRFLADFWADWDALNLSLWMVAYSINQTPWAWHHMPLIGLAHHDYIWDDETLQGRTRYLHDPVLARRISQFALGEMLVCLPSGRLCDGWLVPRNEDEYYLLTTWR